MSEQQEFQHGDQVKVTMNLSVVDSNIEGSVGSVHFNKGTIYLSTLERWADALDHVDVELIERPKPRTRRSRPVAKGRGRAYAEVREALSVGLTVEQVATERGVTLAAIERLGERHGDYALARAARAAQFTDEEWRARYNARQRAYRKRVRA